jgi:hypothetical protein
VEALALVTSLVALLVSAVALYLSSLQLAQIEVRTFDAAGSLIGPRVAGPWLGPKPPTWLSIPIYIWNGGPQGGVLQGVGAFDLEPAGPWSASEPLLLSTTSAEGGRDIPLPKAFEAGDVETAYLHTRLHYSDFDAIEDFAKSLRGLRSITLKIEWSYLRTRRFRHEADLITEEIPVTLDCQLWIDDVVYRWAVTDEWTHLVELAGVPLEIARSKGPEPGAVPP